MSKKLTEIVKQIQFSKDWTVEQVAESIGYSRVHLTKEMKKNESSNLEKVLLEKHKGILQNVAKSETEMQQNVNLSGSSKDEIIELLKEHIRQQNERIQDLRDENHFLKKTVLANLEKSYKNQVLMQSQIWANSRRAAERYAKGNQKTLQEEVSILDTYVEQAAKEVL